MRTGYKRLVSIALSSAMMISGMGMPVQAAEETPESVIVIEAAEETPESGIGTDEEEVIETVQDSIPEADDAGTKYTTTLTPTKITSVPGGSWRLNTGIKPAVDEDTFEGYYAWDTDSVSIRDGRGTGGYNPIRLSRQNDGYNPSYYYSKYTELWTWTPGTYTVTAALQNAQAANETVTAEVTVDELSDSDLDVTVYKTDTAQMKSITPDQSGYSNPTWWNGKSIVDYDLNESNHNVTLKAESVNAGETVEINAGDKLDLTMAALPRGNKWTNFEDLTEYFLSEYHYVTEYKWVISGDSGALKNTLAAKGEFSAANHNIVFDTDEALTDDAELSVTAYVHLHNERYPGYVDADRIFKKSFKIIIHTRSENASQIVMPEEITLYAGDKINLYSDDAIKITLTGAKTAFSGTDDSVFTIQNGILTAKEAGEATLNAVSGEVSSTCKIKVIPLNFNLTYKVQGGNIWTYNDGVIDAQISEQEGGDKLPENGYIDYEWEVDPDSSILLVGQIYGGDYGDDMTKDSGSFKAVNYDMTVGTTVYVTATVYDADNNIIGKARAATDPIYVKGAHFDYMGRTVSIKPSYIAGENWKEKEGSWGEYAYTTYAGDSPVTFTAQGICEDYNNTHKQDEMYGFYDVSYKWSVSDNADGVISSDEAALSGQSVEFTPPADLTEEKTYSLNVETTFTWQNSESAKVNEHVNITVKPQNTVAAPEHLNLKAFYMPSLSDTVVFTNDDFIIDVESYPDGAIPENVVWTVTDKNDLATWSEVNGSRSLHIKTGDKTGKFTVSAKCGKASTDCEVTVIDPITVSQDSVKVGSGYGSSSSITVKFPVNMEIKGASVGLVDQSMNLKAEAELFDEASGQYVKNSSYVYVTMKRTANDTVKVTVTSQEARPGMKGRIILTPQYYGSYYAFLEGYSKVLNVEITESSDKPSSSSEEIPESYEDEKGIAVSKLVFGAKTLKMTVGGSTDNPATPTPAKGVTPPDIHYVTSNADIVSVDSSGAFTAKKSGNATVTAYCGNKKAVCNVIVSNYTTDIVIRDHDGTEVTDSSIELKAGEQELLTVGFVPEETTDPRTVTWRSSNSKAVKVAGGLITAAEVKNAEEVEITATVKVTDPSTGKTGKTVQRKVKVNVEPVAVPAVSANDKSHTLKIGKSSLKMVTTEELNTSEIGITVSPKKGVVLSDISLISAESTNEDVITVEATELTPDTSGKKAAAKATITAHAPGTAYVIVRTKSEVAAGENVKKCKVTVTSPALEITVDEESITMRQGSYQYIKPAVNPGLSTDAPKLKISGSGGVTVKNGVIYAKTITKAKPATITIKCGKVTKKISVTVTM